MFELDNFDKALPQWLFLVSEDDKRSTGVVSTIVDVVQQVLLDYYLQYPLVAVTAFVSVRFVVRKVLNARGPQRKSDGWWKWLTFPFRDKPTQHLPEVDKNLPQTLKQSFYTRGHGEQFPNYNRIGKPDKGSTIKLLATRHDSASTDQAPKAKRAVSLRGGNKSSRPMTRDQPLGSEAQENPLKVNLSITKEGKLNFVSDKKTSQGDTSDRPKVMIDTFNEITCLEAADVQDSLSFTEVKEVGKSKILTGEDISQIKQEDKLDIMPVHTSKLETGKGKRESTRNIPLKRKDLSHRVNTKGDDSIILGACAPVKVKRQYLDEYGSFIMADEAATDLIRGDFSSICNKYASAEKKAKWIKKDAFLHYIRHKALPEGSLLYKHAYDSLDLKEQHMPVRKEERRNKRSAQTHLHHSKRSESLTSLFGSPSGDSDKYSPTSWGISSSLAQNSALHNSIHSTNPFGVNMEMSNTMKSHMRSENRQRARHAHKCGFPVDHVYRYPNTADVRCRCLEKQCIPELQNRKKRYRSSEQMQRDERPNDNSSNSKDLDSQHGPSSECTQCSFVSKTEEDSIKESEETVRCTSMKHMDTERHEKSYCGDHPVDFLSPHSTSYLSHMFLHPRMDRGDPGVNTLKKIDRGTVTSKQEFVSDKALQTLGVQNLTRNRLGAKCKITASQNQEVDVQSSNKENKKGIRPELKKSAELQEKLSNRQLAKEMASLKDKERCDIISGREVKAESSQKMSTLSQLQFTSGTGQEVAQATTEPQEVDNLKISTEKGATEEKDQHDIARDPATGENTAAANGSNKTLQVSDEISFSLRPADAERRLSVKKANDSNLAKPENKSDSTSNYARSRKRWVNNMMKIAPTFHKKINGWRNNDRSEVDSDVRRPEGAWKSNHSNEDDTKARVVQQVERETNVPSNTPSSFRFPNNKKALLGAHPTMRSKDIPKQRSTIGRKSSNTADSKCDGRFEIVAVSNLTNEPDYEKETETPQTMSTDKKLSLRQRDLPACHTLKVPKGSGLLNTYSSQKDNVKSRIRAWRQERSGKGFSPLQKEGSDSITLGSNAVLPTSVSCADRYNNSCIKQLVKDTAELVKTSGECQSINLPSDLADIQGVIKSLGCHPKTYQIVYDPEAVKIIDNRGSELNETDVSNSFGDKLPERNKWDRRPQNQKHFLRERYISNMKKVNNAEMYEAKELQELQRSVYNVTDNRVCKRKSHSESKEEDEEEPLRNELLASFPPPLSHELFMRFSQMLHPDNGSEKTSYDSLHKPAGTVRKGDRHKKKETVSNHNKKLLNSKPHSLIPSPGSPQEKVDSLKSEISQFCMSHANSPTGKYVDLLRKRQEVKQNDSEKAKIEQRPTDNVDARYGKTISQKINAYRNVLSKQTKQLIMPYPNQVTKMSTKNVKSLYSAESNESSSPVYKVFSIPRITQQQIKLCTEYMAKYGSGSSQAKGQCSSPENFTDVSEKTDQLSPWNNRDIGETSSDQMIFSKKERSVPNVESVSSSKYDPKKENSKTKNYKHIFSKRPRTKKKTDAKREALQMIFASIKAKNNYRCNFETPYPTGSKGAAQNVQSHQEYVRKIIEDEMSKGQTKNTTKDARGGNKKSACNATETKKLGKYGLTKQTETMKSLQSRSGIPCKLPMSQSDDIRLTDSFSQTNVQDIGPDGLHRKNEGPSENPLGHQSSHYGRSKAVSEIKYGETSPKNKKTDPNIMMRKRSSYLSAKRQSEPTSSAKSRSDSPFSRKLDLGKVNKMSRSPDTVFRRSNKCKFGSIPSPGGKSKGFSNYMREGWKGPLSPKPAQKESPNETQVSKKSMSQWKHRTKQYYKQKLSPTRTIKPPKDETINVVLPDTCLSVIAVNSKIARVSPLWGAPDEEHNKFRDVAEKVDNSQICDRDTGMRDKGTECELHEEEKTETPRKSVATDSSNLSRTVSARHTCIKRQTTIGTSTTITDSKMPPRHGIAISSPNPKLRKKGICYRSYKPRAESQGSSRTDKKDSTDSKKSATGPGISFQKLYRQSRNDPRLQTLQLSRKKDTAAQKNMKREPESMKTVRGAHRQPRGGPQQYRESRAGKPEKKKKSILKATTPGQIPETVPKSKDGMPENVAKPKKSETGLLSQEAKIKESYTHGLEEITDIDMEDCLPDRLPDMIGGSSDEGESNTGYVTSGTELIAPSKRWQEERSAIHLDDSKSPHDQNVEEIRQKYDQNVEEVRQKYLKELMMKRQKDHKSEDATITLDNVQHVAGIRCKESDFTLGSETKRCLGLHLADVLRQGSNRHLQDASNAEASNKTSGQVHTIFSGSSFAMDPGETKPENAVEHSRELLDDHLTNRGSSMTIENYEKSNQSVSNVFTEESRHNQMARSKLPVPLEYISQEKTASKNNNITEPREFNESTPTKALSLHAKESFAKIIQQKTTSSLSTSKTRNILSHASLVSHPLSSEHEPKKTDEKQKSDLQLYKKSFTTSIHRPERTMNKVLKAQTRSDTRTLKGESEENVNVHAFLKRSTESTLTNREGGESINRRSVKSRPKKEPHVVDIDVLYLESDAGSVPNKITEHGPAKGKTSKGNRSMTWSQFDSKKEKKRSKDIKRGNAVSATQQVKKRDESTDSSADVVISWVESSHNQLSGQQNASLQLTHSNAYHRHDPSPEGLHTPEWPFQSSDPTLGGVEDVEPTKNNTSHSVLTDEKTFAMNAKESVPHKGNRISMDDRDQSLNKSLEQPRDTDLPKAGKRSYSGDRSMSALRRTKLRLQKPTIEADTALTFKKATDRLSFRKPGASKGETTEKYSSQEKTAFSPRSSSTVVIKAQREQQRGDDLKSKAVDRNLPDDPNQNAANATRRINSNRKYVTSALLYTKKKQHGQSPDKPQDGKQANSSRECDPAISTNNSASMGVSNNHTQYWSTPQRTNIRTKLACPENIVFEQSCDQISDPQNSPEPRRNELTTLNISGSVMKTSTSREEHFRRKRSFSGACKYTTTVSDTSAANSDSTDNSENEGRQQRSKQNFDHACFIRHRQQKQRRRDAAGCLITSDNINLDHGMEQVEDGGENIHSVSARQTIARDSQREEPSATGGADCKITFDWYKPSEYSTAQTAYTNRQQMQDDGSTSMSRNFQPAVPFHFWQPATSSIHPRRLWPEAESVSASSEHPFIRGQRNRQSFARQQPEAERAPVTHTLGRFSCLNVQNRDEDYSSEMNRHFGNSTQHFSDSVVKDSTSQKSFVGPDTESLTESFPNTRAFQQYISRECSDHYTSSQNLRFTDTTRLTMNLDRRHSGVPDVNQTMLDREENDLRRRLVSQNVFSTKDYRNCHNRDCNRGNVFRSSTTFVGQNDNIDINAVGGRMQLYGNTSSCFNNYNNPHVYGQPESSRNLDINDSFVESGIYSPCTLEQQFPFARTRPRMLNQALENSSISNRQWLSDRMRSRQTEVQQHEGRDSHELGPLHISRVNRFHIPSDNQFHTHRNEGTIETEPHLNTEAINPTMPYNTGRLMWQEEMGHSAGSGGGRSSLTQDIDYRQPNYVSTYLTRTGTAGPQASAAISRFTSTFRHLSQVPLPDGGTTAGPSAGRYEQRFPPDSTK